MQQWSKYNMWCISATLGIYNTKLQKTPFKNDFPLKVKIITQVSTLSLINNVVGSFNFEFHPHNEYRPFL
jgi:hypothetical protein